METGILLESGTNELEILEFKVGKNYYGINVAKIREIISYQTPTPIPNADPRIEGIFMPRDEIISIIDLAEVMHLEKPDKVTNDMYIVTNFNQLNTAFHVNGVLGIHRVSWSDIVKPDSTINTAGEGMATGIIRIDDKLIIILDFEKIVAEINPITMVRETTEIDMSRYYDRNGKTIFLAEDSPTIRKLLQSSFTRAGYNTMSFENGIDLLTRLRREKPALIITDLEMPGGSGDYVVRKTREKEIFNDVPILVFSSMVSVENERKLLNIGASRFIGKPDLSDLIKAVDEFVLDKKGIIIHKEIVQ